MPGAPRVQTIRKPGSSTAPVSPKIEDMEPEKPAAEYKPGKYKEPVEMVHTGVGLALVKIAPQTGMRLIEDAEKIAIEWDKLSRVNPKVKKFLDKAFTTGAWSTLLMAYSTVGISAVQESGVLSKIPGLKKFFPKLGQNDNESVVADEFGNPLPQTPADPLPFERRTSA